MPFGLQPKYLFRDNDGIYGNGVRAFLDSCGIEEVRTAYRSPWQNPFVERFIEPVMKLYESIKQTAEYNAEEKLKRDKLEEEEDNI